MYIHIIYYSAIKIKGMFFLALISVNLNDTMLSKINQAQG